jgi:2-polyprenyl-6-methoxyphenol hydroxylase-like FAD-dependent oxidoreductase
MQNQNILISGASVAGPALAWWLARHGFRPTVVERAPDLRGGGYAVDFRGAAHLSVLAQMGLLDQVKERQTHLRATTCVDEQSRPLAAMPASIFAGDVEILRGDLGRILYEATRDDTEYLFGDSITSLRQDAGGVHVTFARSAALGGAQAGLRRSGRPGRPGRSGRRPRPVRLHLRRARPLRPGP